MTDDLYRLLSNLIRTGTVLAVRHSRPARVRVSIGNLESEWLQFVSARAGTSKTWDPPTVGEQVVVFSPGGDLTAGIVLCGLNSDAVPAPSDSATETVRDFPDGTRFVHDHSSGTMSVTGMQNLLLEAAGNITLRSASTTIDSAQITSTGEHSVLGLLKYLAGLAGENGAGGSTKINGSIEHENGALTSNGVVVHLHIHSGVVPGGGNTQEPVV